MPSRSPVSGSAPDRASGVAVSRRLAGSRSTGWRRHRAPMPLDGRARSRRWANDDGDGSRPSGYRGPGHRPCRARVSRRSSRWLPERTVLGRRRRRRRRHVRRCEGRASGIRAPPTRSRHRSGPRGPALAIFTCWVAGPLVTMAIRHPAARSCSNASPTAGVGLEEEGVVALVVGEELLDRLRQAVAVAELGEEVGPSGMAVEVGMNKPVDATHHRGLGRRERRPPIDGTPPAGR